MQDCAGVWGGDASYDSYYFDFDGDGLGAGASNIYCSAFVPSGWVTNNDDSEPNCVSNNNYIYDPHPIHPHNPAHSY